MLNVGHSADQVGENGIIYQGKTKKNNEIDFYAEKKVKISSW
jgi:hypothetical protein